MAPTPYPEPGTPQYYARMARACFVTAPFGAAFAFVLAWLQRGELWVCALCAAIIFLGTTGFGLLVHLRGANAAGDAGWIMAILRLLARR